ncbi:MAG TPA: anti-sigma factor [Aggregatilineales bacterium]|nr:anti-sigma factor [Anaerolineales bacterium]HRE47678.1 anti-sigma factor [Aggregatilineales bacterium]
MMNDSVLEDRIIAYVLGTLSAAERAEVEAITSRNSEAAALLSEYQASLYGYTAVTTPRRSAPAAAEAAFRARLAEFSGTTSAPAKPNSRLSTRRVVYALAAAIITLVLGVLVLFRPSTNPTAAILGDANAVRVAFAPQGEGSPEGALTFVTVKGRAEGVIVAALPLISDEWDYQLWFIDEEAIHSGGVFPATTESYLVTIPEAGRAYTLGVTIEKRGGVAQPSGSPIFAAQLPALP